MKIIKLVPSVSDFGIQGIHQIIFMIMSKHAGYEAGKLWQVQNCPKHAIITRLVLENVFSPLVRFQTGGDLVKLLKGAKSLVETGHQDKFIGVRN